MAVKFEGLEEIELMFDKVVNTENISDAVEKGCALVEADAKIKAPKGTGALRRSIESKVESGGDTITGIVFSSLEYAPYVEYGTGIYAEKGGRSDVPWAYQDDKGDWHLTSGMKSRPYLRPALKENRKQIVEKIREGIIDG